MPLYRIEVRDQPEGSANVTPSVITEQFSDEATLRDRLTKRGWIVDKVEEAVNLPPEPTVDSAVDDIKRLIGEERARDLGALFGPNADYYLARYQEQKEREQAYAQAAGFWGRLRRARWQKIHWPAIFVGPIWFFYRKQYLPAVGIIAASIVLALLLPKAGSFSINAILGVMASPYYVRWAERQITKVDKLNLAPPEREAWLQKAGGTSVGGAILGVLLGISMIVLPYLGAVEPVLPACNSPVVTNLLVRQFNERLTTSGLQPVTAENLTLTELAAPDPKAGRECRVVLRQGSESVTMDVVMTWVEGGKTEFRLRRIER